MKYARCGGSCRHYYLLSAMAKAVCPSCTYTAHRCDKCGGEHGAARSVFAHGVYWNGRGGAKGGHDANARAIAKQNLQKTRPQGRKTRAR